MNRDTKADMFRTYVELYGVKLYVDPIDMPRTEKRDIAMPIFYEEQPFMWQFVREEIVRALSESSGEIDFLDVGTGSGVWSALVRRNTAAASILAIDKSPRAIDVAQQNMELNEMLFNLRREFYNVSTVPYRSCRLIGLYAPYHLYPADIELMIPQHARGGIYGQQVFKEQLVTMSYHLAEQGSVIFNQMCLGDSNGPAFLTYVPLVMEGCSLHYTNIFPRMKTSDFLAEVYGETYTKYQKETALRFPFLHYCTGWIRRDGEMTINEIKHAIDLRGRSWKNRIDLHCQIRKHGELSL